MNHRHQKLFFTLLFLFTNIFFLSHAKIITNNADEKNLKHSRKIVTYENFWDAMKNLDFSYLKNHEVTDEQLQFSRALKLATNGQYIKAEDAFKKLYSSTNFLNIKKESKEILSNLLLLQSKWKALFKLESDKSRNNKKDDNNTIILWEAFSKSPEEEYHFPPQSKPLPTKFKYGVAIVPVMVNGEKRNFLIDTGAGLSAIASDIAKKCHVFPIGNKTGKAGTGTSKKVKIQPAIIKELRIGGISIKNHPLIIINKKDLEFKLFGIFRIFKIEGILGWNVLQKMNITIDYKKKVTIIKKPIKGIKKKDQFFWMDYPIVTLKSQDGVKLNFLLDTGANETSITSNIFKKINIKKRSTQRKAVGSAGGFEWTKSQIIHDLTLFYKNQKLYFKKIKTGTSEKDHFIINDGRLGNNIYREGIVHIDFKNGIFEFE